MTKLNGIIAELTDIRDSAKLYGVNNEGAAIDVFIDLSKLITFRPATEPAITATVLTINCNNCNAIIVEPTPRPETSNFSIVLTNVTNTDLIQVSLQLTGTIIITMPSNVKVSNPSSIGVWDDGLKTLTMTTGTADEIGLNFLWNKSGLFWDLAVGEVAI